MRKLLLITFIAIAVITFVVTRSAYSIEKSDHDCLKCHNVTNAEVLNLLKGSFPDIKVLDVRPAQVKGLIEVTVESQGQKGILYIDSSSKYLISGSILDVKTKANFTQQRYNEINKVDISQIPLDDALVMGDKDAKYRVIVLDDPD
jgi:thiol:disulfide interchange protein DsbC